MGKFQTLQTHCKRGHEFTEENTRSTKNGGRVCKTCKRLQSQKEYKTKIKNPEFKNKKHSYDIKSGQKQKLKKYGISEKDLDVLQRVQDNKCAICKCTFIDSGKSSRINIDHNHQNGLVRGLLCSRCNTGIGLFKDNKEFLMSAINYLEGKRAFITGILGQDGHYLSHLLVNKGYEVHGLVRRTAYPHINLPHLPKEVILHEGDLTDFSSIHRIISNIRPHEIYNLAAQSNVGTSFKEPLHTTQVNYLGFANILESVRLINSYNPKIYQASTSEMFGGIGGKIKLNEESPFHPRSPYGCSKLAAYYLGINYKESYGMHICNGILFNHESTFRGPNFVTRKITLGIKDIIDGKIKKIKLGNLEAMRDWSHAEDMVRGMWLMTNYSKPDNYILASGETNTIRYFCKVAFEYAGLGSYENYIESDPSLIRPAEVDILLGDSTKAKEVLGWKPEYSFESLVKEMVEQDLK